jgi:hypothetical protein
VTKARVLGIDKDTTKTREDRIIQLSPRAIAVLRRQLALYRDLKAHRLVVHNQIFFKDDGAPGLTPSSAERDSAEQVGLTAERLSNTESRLPPDLTPVPKFGTRFVTRWGTLATQVPEEKEKESGGEGGIRNGRNP